MKTGKCKTVENWKWYVIEKKADISDIALFDANGKPISLSLLKKMLKKV